MPDRVKLPQGFPQRYKSEYKQICEHQSPSSIARSAVRKLKKDVKEFGTGGSALISKVSNYLEPLAQDSLLKMFPNSWDDAHEMIDIFAQDVNGDRQFVKLAGDACKKVAIRLEQGEQVENLSVEIEKHFYLNVWYSRVEDRIPLQGSYYANADYDGIKDHLQEIGQHLEQEIENHLLHVKPPQEVDLLEIDIMNGDL